MSTAAIGSAGAREPPHLPDRTTNTPTTWRLYSPLCCSRASPSPGRRAGVTVGLSSQTHTSCSPLPCPARPPGTEGCSRMCQRTLKPRWGQNCCFLDPPITAAPLPCVCVCLSLQILWIFFFSQPKFCREWEKFSKLTLVH